MSHRRPGTSVIRSRPVTRFRQNRATVGEPGSSAAVPITATGSVIMSSLRSSGQSAGDEDKPLRGYRYAVGAQLVRPGDHGRALQQVQRDLSHGALGMLGQEAATRPAVERADRRAGPQLIVGAP